MQDIEMVSNIDFPWNKLKGKNVLITGAGGISSFLAHVLMFRNMEFNNNINVFVMTRNAQKAQVKFANYADRTDFKIIQHDVTQFIPGRQEFHVIFHCASNTHPIEYESDPIGTITTNVFGTYNLLEMNNPVLERFVLLSSVEIYGESTILERFSEKDFGYIDCNTLRAGYPESKRVAESLCQAYIYKNKKDIVIARPCRLYGYSEPDDSKAASQFIRNAVNKENIVLKSKGNQKYSFLYLPDCISALLFIFFYGLCGEAYNIADERSNITLFEFASIVAKIVGTTVRYDMPNDKEKKGFSVVKNAVLDNSKLAALGWTARYTIEDGIKEAIRIAVL